MRGRGAGYGSAMGSSERGMYTLLGWITWRVAKWYLVRRLGLQRKLAKGALVLAGTAAVGGTALVIRSRATSAGGSSRP